MFKWLREHRERAEKREKWLIALEAKKRAGVNRLIALTPEIHIGAYCWEGPMADHIEALQAKIAKYEAGAVNKKCQCNGNCQRNGEPK